MTTGKGKKTTLWKRITHQRVDVSISIDRDSGKFWAEVGGQRIEHELAAEAERLVKEAIDRSLATTWSPFIEVTIMDYGDGSSDRQHAIAIKYDRKQYADVPGLGLSEAPWHAKDDQQRLSWSHRLNWIARDHGPFALPCVRGWSASKSVTYYLPYSEDLWSGLDAMIQGIKGLDTTIRSTFSERHGAGLVETLMPLLRFLPVE